MVSLVRMESNRHVESLEEGLLKVSLERLPVVTDSMVEAFSPCSSEAMTILACQAFSQHKLQIPTFHQHSTIRHLIK